MQLIMLSTVNNIELYTNYFFAYWLIYLVFLCCNCCVFLPLGQTPERNRVQVLYPEACGAPLSYLQQLVAGEEVRGRLQDGGHGLRQLLVDGAAGGRRERLRLKHKLQHRST